MTYIRRPLLRARPPYQGRRQTDDCKVGGRASPLETPLMIESDDDQEMKIAGCVRKCPRETREGGQQRLTLVPAAERATIM